MSTPLDLVTSRQPDGTPLVTATGEIDLSNADEFRRALDEAAGDGRIVVDLRAVDYLDSAGLAALFSHVPDLELWALPLLDTLLTVSGLADLAQVRISEG